MLILGKRQKLNCWIQGSGNDSIKANGERLSNDLHCSEGIVLEKSCHIPLYAFGEIQKSQEARLLSLNGIKRV
jgi:hypothetical protein